MNIRIWALTLCFVGLGLKAENVAAAKKQVFVHEVEIPGIEKSCLEESSSSSELFQVRRRFCAALCKVAFNKNSEELKSSTSPLNEPFCLRMTGGKIDWSEEEVAKSVDLLMHGGAKGSSGVANLSRDDFNYFMDDLSAAYVRIGTEYMVDKPLPLMKFVGDLLEKSRLLVQDKITNEQETVEHPVTEGLGLVGKHATGYFGFYYASNVLRNTVLNSAAVPDNFLGRHIDRVALRIRSKLDKNVKYSEISSESGRWNRSATFVSKNVKMADRRAIPSGRVCTDVLRRALMGPITFWGAQLGYVSMVPGKALRDYAKLLWGEKDANSYSDPNSVYSMALKDFMSQKTLDYDQDRAQLLELAARLVSKEDTHAYLDKIISERKLNSAASQLELSELHAEIVKGMNDGQAEDEEKVFARMLEKLQNNVTQEERDDLLSDFAEKAFAWANTKKISKEKMFWTEFRAEAPRAGLDFTADVSNRYEQIDKLKEASDKFSAAFKVFMGEE